MMKNLFGLLDALPAVIESSTQSIYITDSERRIIYVNKAFTRFLGYTYNDVKFKNPKILASGCTPQETYDDLKTKLETEGRWSGVLINQTRSGVKIKTNSFIKRLESCSGVYYYSIANSSISDSQMDNQALLDVFKKLGKAANDTNIGIWDWNITTGDLTINEHWANIIGYSLEELQPISINALERFIHPDDLKIANAELEKCIRGEQSLYEVCVRMKHRKGHWVWVLNKGETTEFDEQDKPREIRVIYSDFSEETRSREQLEYRIHIEALLHSITSSLIDADPENLNEKLNFCLERIGVFTDIDRVYLFISKDNGKIMDNTNEWCNNGIEPQINNLRDLQMSLFPWWLSKLSALENIYTEDVKQMPTTAMAERARLESMGVKSLLIVPVHIKGELLGCIGFGSMQKLRKWNDNDIHILGSIADAVASALTSVNSYEKLLAATEKANESNRLKSTFISTMSHEVRTPLNHIIGFSDIINFSTDDAEIKEFTNVIKSSGTELLAIIEDIMEYSQLQASGWKLELKSVMLVDIYATIKESLLRRLKVAEKDEKIMAMFENDPATLGCMITCDAGKITKILNIFIANAVKFTDSGEIIFGCSRPSKTSVLFYIKDTGIGIPKDKQEIVFDLFRQADDTNTRRFGGTGIGLNMAKKLAEAINAEITFESSENGSIFSLVFPCLCGLYKNDATKAK